MDSEPADCCNNCGYDLSGLARAPDDAMKCPECGVSGCDDPRLATRVLREFLGRYWPAILPCVVLTSLVVYIALPGRTRPGMVVLQEFVKPVFVMFLMSATIYPVAVSVVLRSQRRSWGHAALCVGGVMAINVAIVVLGFIVFSHFFDAMGGS